MYVIDVNDLRNKLQDKELWRSAASINVDVGEKRVKVYFAEQETGYGVRKFFLCPHCGERKVKLYFVGDSFRCAKCGKIKPYKGLQNGTKGGYRELQYRMMKYGAKHGITVQFPFDYLQCFRADQIMNEEYRAALMVLQALENLRFQNILYKTVYPKTVIDRVLDGTHPMLFRVTLKDMQTKLYRFDL